MSIFYVLTCRFLQSDHRAKLKMSMLLSKADWSPMHTQKFKLKQNASNLSVMYINSGQNNQFIAVYNYYISHTDYIVYINLK